MLNELAFRKIFEVPPEVEVIAIDKLDLNHTPRDYNLSAVLSTMSKNLGMLIGDIMRITNLSKYCTHKCIKHLLSAGAIESTFEGTNGKYDFFSYRLVK